MNTAINLCVTRLEISQVFINLQVTKSAILYYQHEDLISALKVLFYETKSFKHVALHQILKKKSQLCHQF